MSRWRSWCLFLGLSLVAGCGSKANPAATCMQGTCIDPNFPYCDVDGAVSGTAGQCVAVTCAAGMFSMCSDNNTALACNDFGNGYTPSPCPNGCDPVTGCKLCEANQTVCQNGAVATCDASGNQTSKTQCPLGCFEDQPRCRGIDPSNHLAQYLDMVTNPPDLDLADAHFDVVTGIVTDGANAVSVPNFLVPAPQNGAPIRVFVANHVKVSQATIDWAYSNGMSPNGPAFALLARNDVTIAGVVTVSPLAGGFSQGGCDGGYGQVYDLGSPCESSGGGGGGNATAGGHGGSVTGRLNGGTQGSPGGAETLVPLRGGCQGGSDIEVGQTYSPPATWGGGAIQISSATKVLVNGAIVANGEDGNARDFLQSTGYLIPGGGAGGSILLEAPSVTLGPGGQLEAHGGNANSPCTVANANCALGGHGADLSTAATSGFDATFAGVPSVSAGGGGGGWGRIRINSADGTFTSSNTSVQDGAVSAGLLGTR